MELLPVAAGALAFVRWAAGGHGQQCIVSGFHFFVFFLLPRGRSFRFLSFYLFICRHEDGPVRAHSPHGASPQGGFFFFCLDSYRDAVCPVCYFIPATKMGRCGRIAHPGLPLRAGSSFSVSIAIGMPAALFLFFHSRHEGGQVRAHSPLRTSPQGGFFFFLSRIAIGMRAIPFCLFLYRRLAMKNGRGGRIALSEIPFRASPPCLSDFRRLCPKG